MRATRVGVALLVSLLVLAACSGDDDANPDQVGAEAEQEAATDTDEVTDDGAEGSKDGTDDEDEGPRSTVETEELDAPMSAAEIRVGEIIVEFDGEVVDEGTLLTLEEPILFDFDSAELKDSAREALDDVTEVLEFYADAPVQIVGHTDDVGSEEYNLDLSQDRADAVADALRERGVDPDRLTSEGRGLQDPVASNDTEAGRAANRRVEVLVEGVEPPAAE